MRDGVLLASLSAFESDGTLDCLGFGWTIRPSDGIFELDLLGILFLLLDQSGQSL